MKIKASCEASECLDPSGPKLVGAAVERHTGPPLGPPLLAALPLLALLLAGLVCAAALVRYMPFLRPKHRTAATAAAAGGSSGKGGGSSHLGMNGLGGKQGLAGGSPRNGGFGKSLPGPVAEGLESSGAAAAAGTAAAGSSGSSSPRAAAGAGNTAASPQGLTSDGSSSPRSGFTGVGTGLQGLPSDGSTPRSSPTAAAAAAGTAAAAAAAAVPMVPLLRLTAPPRPSGTGSSLGSGQIQELSFYDVTADVKVPRGFKELARSVLHRDRRTTSSSSSGSNAAGKGDVEQGALKGSNSTGVLTDGSKAVTTGYTSEKSPLGRGVTGDSMQLLTEQQQHLPEAAGGSSGSNGRWRRVLQGVSGVVGSGEVMGVMGPSGGGKSTLLMKLCGGLGGHSRGGEWRSGGVVCLDGVVVPPSLLTAVTALVPQDDSLMRSLTVEECIR